MKKGLFLFVFSAILAASTIAQDTPSFGIKFSGFVKTDIFWDSRQTVAAREGHFLLFPTNENLDAEKLDLEMTYKMVENYLVQHCQPLKELAFTENKKFKYASSDNVLAQLAYDDGMEYINDGDIENAILKFTKAVQIDPNFAFAWDNMGISYRKNEQYEKAIEAYLKSLEIYPDGRLPLLNIAITYNLNKQYIEAVTYYNKFIKIYSEDPEGYYGLGLILYTQDQEEAGLDHLIRAYTIYTSQNSPYRADAAKKIGYMYKDLKNQDKLEVFNKVADKYNLKVQNN